MADDITRPASFGAMDTQVNQRSTFRPLVKGPPAELCRAMRRLLLCIDKQAGDRVEVAMRVADSHDKYTARCYLDVRTLLFNLGQDIDQTSALERKREKVIRHAERYSIGAQRLSELLEKCEDTPLDLDITARAEELGSSELEFNISSELPDASAAMLEHLEMFILAQGVPCTDHGGAPDVPCHEHCPYREDTGK